MSLLPHAEERTALSPTSPTHSGSSVNRRSLFAGATAVGAVAAVAALLPASPQINDMPVAQEPAATPERGGGYALTERVKQYYQTARV
ncbi:MAG: hypothetical protein RLZZ612_1882 [Pseudomonadota bacterium]|jgi:hypothetical protein